MLTRHDHNVKNYSQLHDSASKSIVEAIVDTETHAHNRTPPRIPRPAQSPMACTRGGIYARPRASECRAASTHASFEQPVVVDEVDDGVVRLHGVRHVVHPHAYVELVLQLLQPETATTRSRHVNNMVPTRQCGPDAATWSWHVNVVRTTSTWSCHVNVVVSQCSS